MKTLNQIAKTVAILTLAIALVAPFSMIIVPSNIFVTGDAAATAANAAASQGLLRGSLAIDGLVFLLEIVLVVALYELLKPVNATLALMAAFARLAMTIVQGFNLLNHFIPLLLVSDPQYAASLGEGSFNALVSLFFSAHQSVEVIWGLFFALHLLLAGILVIRSGYIAKFAGAALLLASLAYFVQGFGTILAPQFQSVFDTVGMLSMVELVFPIWLLAKRVKEQA